MTAALPLLHELPDQLAKHADCHITFHSPSSSTRVSFGAFHAEVVAATAVAKELGFAAGAVVGVVAANSRAALLLDLAMLALRCTVVHIPEREAAPFMAVDSGPALDFLIVDDAHQALAAGMAAHGELADLAVYRSRHSNWPRDARIDDCPAVIFSSGTSGRVKRLVVSRDGVLHNAQVFFDFVDPLPDDLFLIFLPLSNFQQKLLIYGCLLKGVSLCITDPRGVMSALKQHEPTLFLAPPIFYESAWSLSRIARNPSATAGSHADLHAIFGGRMRKMYSGMAPIAATILEAYGRAGVPIFEAYGMTEFGPICANGPQHNAVGSVGRPLTAGSVSVADDGEIMVHSPLPLTLSYLGESVEDTRAVYVDAHTIATGDIGHFDEQGFLYIRGRKKQIIITSQGYKVHPESIEREFYEFPFVVHAVVMGERRADLGMLVVVESADADAEKALQARVAQLNEGLCQLHPIKKLCIRTEKFTPDNRLLTANMKLDRSRIAERYHNELFQ